MRSRMIRRSTGASFSKLGNTFFKEWAYILPPVMFFAPAKLPRSTMSTLLPAFARVYAATDPAHPAPTTIASKSDIALTLLYASLALIFGITSTMSPTRP